MPLAPGGLHPISFAMKILRPPVLATGLGLATVLSGAAWADGSTTYEDGGPAPGYTLRYQFDPNALAAQPDAPPEPVHIPDLATPSLPDIPPVHLGPVQAGVDPKRLGAYAGTNARGLNLQAGMDAADPLSLTTPTGRVNLGVEPGLLPRGMGLSLEASNPLDLTAKPGDPTAFATGGRMTLRGDLPVGTGRDLSLEARQDNAADASREVYLRYKMGW